MFRSLKNILGGKSHWENTQAPCARALLERTRELPHPIDILFTSFCKASSNWLNYMIGPERLSESPFRSRTNDITTSEMHSLFDANLQVLLGVFTLTSAVDREKLMATYLTFMRLGPAQATLLSVISEQAELNVGYISSRYTEYASTILNDNPSDPFSYLSLAPLITTSFQLAMSEFNQKAG